MKAKLLNQNDNGYNFSSEKEMIDSLNLIAVRDNKAQELITARFYMGRSSSASKVYCSIWVHGNGYYSSGKGSAGGYGYCKRSAAFAEAVRSAGIDLSESVSGRGMWSCEDALKAIARSLGYRGDLLIVRN